MDWPGYELAPPVIINGRPQRQYRPRQASEHMPGPVYYSGSHGEYLIPASGGGGGGGLHRSASAAGYARPPTQVTIYNENLAYDDHSSRRPISSHGHHRHYHEDEYSDRSRSRSRSRVRVRSRSRSRVPRRAASPYYESEYEIEANLKRLALLDQKAEDEKRKRRIEEEMILKAAKEEADKAARKKEEEELKKRAIVEYNIKQAEEKAKKKKAEEEAEKEVKERMWKTLHNNGYSDAEIEDIMKRGEKKTPHGKAHQHEHIHVVGESSTQVLTLARPTYIKVNKKHLDPYTLDVYELDWEWDEHDSNFIIIKQWIPEHDQDILFEHTRKHREQKLLTDTTTELRKEHNQLLLVRKKEPSRKKSPAAKIRIFR